MHTRCAGPVAGTGTVVLVHGLGMSSRYMVRALQLLAQDRQVYAPDLPGFGRSTRPAHPLELTEFADALVGWMDALGMGEVALVGHSMGCQVAGEVAGRHPDRVTRLVLTSPARDPHARWPWQYAGRLLRDAPREAPSLLPIAVTDYLRAGPARMWRDLVDSMRLDPTERIRRIGQPVLVVRGERDPVATQQWAQTLTGLLPAAALVTLPGAPHGLNYTAADTFTHTVRHFLDSDPSAVARR